MSELFAAFGIDWRLLIINMVNFGLLLAGLWYFLYHPIMRMLEVRREKIAQGILDAQQAQQKLEEIETSRAHTLAEAGREADSIVSSARAAGTDKQREIVAHAQDAAAALLSEAEAQAREAKAQAVHESKEEVARLIVLGMERVLKEKQS